MAKKPSANAGDARDMGLIPGLEISPRVRNGNPLQYSCLENSMDRGAWQATVHGVTKSWTRMSIQTHTHTHTQYVAHIQTLDNTQWGNSYSRLESCWTDFDMTNYLIKWSSTDTWKASNVFPESQDGRKQCWNISGNWFMLLAVAFHNVLKEWDETKQELASLQAEREFC